MASRSHIGRMVAVGVRELKNRLSEFLRRVRAGERILVTKRGEVVAELRQPGGPEEGLDVPSGLAALIRDGRASPGSPNDPEAYPALDRLLPDGEARRLLEEERGTR